MVKGQKVVCINDTFSPTVRALYQQLPVKDNIYTIREVFLGREKIVKGGAGVWGQVPMPANPQVSADEAKTLAKWVLGM